jgi:hypothetical protein
LESLWGGLLQRETFASVNTYALFIGHSRSGTSLIGSLLNAHHNVLMTHELGALRFIRARFGRDQLFWLHYAKDKQFERNQRHWTGYDFRVPNQWQGRFDELQVIGDKRGAMTTIGLQRWPHLLERLQRTVQVPVRFVHTLRHPLDNIASVCRQNNASLDQAIDWYRNGTEVNAALMLKLGEAVHTLRMEDFIANPVAELAKLCPFLDISAGSDYLSDCASIVFERPQSARQRVTWTSRHLDSVRRIVERFPFLRGYDCSDAEGWSAGSTLARAA